ncbi:MAG: GIY-YIG nuclease family protein [Candidatus Pacebacteria bacterium]|nr:GIY-YIG nuclease family protein [Candidatus Paceibacterota bacterium]
MTQEEYKKIELPKKPGVYFFKKDEEILYIGKATNLAHRTSSYFQKNLMETRGPLIVKMVEEINTVEWTETDSALEALILESYLIKQHQPAYNTREKDNRSYNYVVITNELAPRVFTMRQRALRIIEGKQDDSLLHVFGPFPDMDQLKTALRIIRKIFPFHGKKTIHRNNIEFYRQLGLVPGSMDDEARDVYMENINYIAMFFKGKKQSLIKKLEKDMMKYAKNLEFERANVLKKQIYALNHIRDMALLKHNFESSGYVTNFRMEAYDIAHIQGDAMVGVMVVYSGASIDNSEHRVFNINSVDRANDTAALYEVITRRLKHSEWPYPQIIVVDGAIAQKRVIEKALREKNLSIPVMAVVKDDRHKAREILGQKKISEKYHKEIVAINVESHRFALKQHTKKREKQFLS